MADEALFLLLHNEMVSGVYKSAEQGEVENGRCITKLENMGFRVGQGLIERFTKDTARFKDELDIMKFICKDFWTTVFKKQIDNLRTNHQGIYVLQDNKFRLLTQMSAGKQYLEHASKGGVRVRRLRALTQGERSRSRRRPRLEQRARLAARGPRSPARAPPLLLLLLWELVRESAAESPWALPVVADGPAPFAKAVMAELAGLKLENKPWPGGTHSLRYHYLALSQPGPGLPQFLAVGYVNDQPFIRYDSRVGRAEPQAPWIAPVDAHYWEMETQKQKAWAEVQQVEMWTVMGFYNQSGGTHSAQRMFGCEIQEDGRSSSFWQFGFDGRDHLSLDLETLSWVSAEPMAVRTKRWSESERCYAEYDKAYLEGLCLASLRRYLELGGPSLTRREPPTVQVTTHTIQGRGAALRCWARGFYPQEISLSWWLREEELSLETEHMETRPSGDGTYQTWAAVWVQAGEEAGYTCRVQHSGLNHTLTVAWEPPPRQEVIAMVTYTIPILVLVVGAGIFTRTRPRARSMESYEQAPGGEGPP